MKTNFCAVRQSFLGKILSIALSILFFVGPNVCAYTVDESRIDGKKEFDDFLEQCSIQERIRLIQTLRGLDTKIKDDLFGKIAGLEPLDKYTKDPQQVKSGKLLRPKTFNEVSPETVLDAINKGYVSLDFSPQAIRKELIWRRYNKVNYVWHDDNKIDYHKDILCWVAEKKDVESNKIASFSSYALEREIANKYFEQIWEKLTIEQRKELLQKIEKDTGLSVGDKAAIAAMSGAGAIAALSATVAFSGFAFYTSMTVVISTVAGWLGITLPFAVYTGTSSVVAAMAGPIGWCLAAVAIGTSAVLLGLPEEDTVASFVIQVNCIKSEWEQKEQHHTQWILWPVIISICVAAGGFWYWNKKRRKIA